MHQNFKTLKAQYLKTQKEIIKLFADKQGIIEHFEPNIIGNVVEIADRFIDMQDIIYDLEEDVKEGAILDYHDLRLERSLEGLKSTTYQTYVKFNFEIDPKKAYKEYTLEDRKKFGEWKVRTMKELEDMADEYISNNQ